MPNESHKRRELLQKGKEAEEFLLQLAERSFFSFWCYPNPCIVNGKELCDLLVIYENTAIVWQVKSLKIHQDTGMHKMASIDKNLRQLIGAKRALINHSSDEIWLKNALGRQDRIRLSEIAKIFLISALLGDEQDFFMGGQEFQNEIIHGLDRKDVEFLMRILDTTGDFVDYLQAKQDWMSARLQNSHGILAIEGGEEDFLAYYLLSGKTLNGLKSSHTVLPRHSDFFEKDAQYLAIKKENQISHLWDGLVKEAQRIESLTDPRNPERIAREIARPNRRQRTALASALLNQIQQVGKFPTGFYSTHIIDKIGTAYCFLFCNASTPEEKKAREAMLGNLCFVTRGRYPQKHTVLGIATDAQQKPYSTISFALLKKGNWTAEDEKNANDIRAACSFFHHSEKEKTEITDF